VDGVDCFMPLSDGARAVYLADWTNEILTNAVFTFPLNSYIGTTG
jgi:hypothetical protein